MNAEEYWASEISDADIDAIADAGDFHLEENGFFFMPSQAEMRTLAEEGERLCNDDLTRRMEDEFYDN